MCQKSYRKLPNKYKVSKKTITTQLEKETIDKQLIQKVTKYIDPETMEIEEFFRREATICTRSETGIFAALSANEPPQTVAIEEEPFDSKISETILKVSLKFFFIVTGKQIGRAHV